MIKALITLFIVLISGYGFPKNIATEQLAPKTDSARDLFELKLFFLIKDVYSDIDQVDLNRILAISYRWITEFEGLIANKRVNLDDAVSMVLFMVRLNSSFFYFKTPSVDKDASLSRLLSPIYGGWYYYKKLNENQEEEIALYHGLYPWLSDKSDDPKSFLRVFLRFVIFACNSSKIDIYSLYVDLDRLGDKFDQLLVILDLVKAESNRDQDDVFYGIWNDIKSKQFALFNKQFETRLFMRFIGARCFAEVMSST